MIFVVPRPGATLDVSELSTYIEERISEPPAKPRHIFIVSALPVTAVGKLFKPTLREQAVVEKLKLEIRRVDASVAVASIRLESEPDGGQIARIELAKDGGGLVSSVVEDRLTEALRELSVKASVHWC